MVFLTFFLILILIVILILLLGTQNVTISTALIVILLLLLIYKWEILVFESKIIWNLIQFPTLSVSSRISRLQDLSKNQLGLKAKIPQTPAIYIANYPTNYIGYLHFFSLRKTLLMTSVEKIPLGFSKFKNIIFVDGYNHLGIKASGNNYQDVTQSILTAISKGQSIYIYPEAPLLSTKKSNQLQRFRTGIFKIALTHKIPIIPVINQDYQENNPNMHLKQMYGSTIRPEKYMSVELLMNAVRNQMETMLLQI